MKPDQPYIDWKKELSVWQATNTAIGVEKRIQAGILFESLDGPPRQTVLSELTVEEITSDVGVENIIKTLDIYFKGNVTKNAFSHIDELMSYRCGKDVKIEKFIVDFQLKVSKVRASGTVLSDGVLGYILLYAANLPEDKTDMVKATCEDVSYKNVKAQLEKIGVGKPETKSKTSIFKNEADSSNIKVEPCFYGKTNRRQQFRNTESSSSSDDDLNGEKTFYTGRRYVDNKNRDDINRRFKQNPKDRFGNVRDCIYCKCVYHWLVDCPYAPNTVKNRIPGGRKKNNNQQL